MNKILCLLLALAGSASAGQTIVSLTFDDGTADHVLAGQMLNARGFKGTFYINSAQLGSSGYYMTRAGADALKAAGHEMGGHSLHHLHLTTLSSSQLQAEICDDRAQMQGWGYAPVSFAYPFAEDNAEVRAMVESCGYTSGRDVGGGKESIPPQNPFLLRTPDSIKDDYTLADIQKLVTDAEQSGGGWVPLVLHRICDGCSLYSVDEPTLASFLDWLKLRSGQGTVVKTVAEVMGAPAPPPDAPVISSLSPSSAKAGGPGFILSVTGSNFTPISSVLWNGSVRSTTYVSAAQLRASISAGDIAVAATAGVAVSVPGVGVSGARSFLAWSGSPPSPGPPADAAALDSVRVFPNPWRGDRHAGLPLVIDGLGPRSEVRLFTLSGQWVRTITAAGGAARWDLVNQAGARVASGTYLYLIIDEGGRRQGTLAVIR